MHVYQQLIPNLPFIGMKISKQLFLCQFKLNLIQQLEEHFIFYMYILQNAKMIVVPITSTCRACYS